MKSQLMLRLPRFRGWALPWKPSIHRVGIGIAAVLIGLQVGLAIYLRLNQWVIMTHPQQLPVGAIATFPDGRTLQLEVARTEVEKIRGLRFREELADEQGMLFQVNPLLNSEQVERGEIETVESGGIGEGVRVDASKRVSLWMDGVRYPLDIVFLKDHRIVQIIRNAPTCNSESADEHSSIQCPLYNSSTSVDQILEIKANSAFNLRIGNLIKIKYLR
jgi:uncharacterized protein